MRRTLPAATALLLVLATTPALAQDGAEPSTDPAASDAGATELQRAEAPAVGIAMSFPAEWRVSRPEGLRLSAITTADGEPVMETTALMANGGGGSWCDVDAYLALDAPLRDHAYAYASYLQQSEGADSTMVVAEAELPVGPAFRIEVFDRSTGRLRAMYLFDGPAAEDGTVNRYLFTCATRTADDPFWEAIAESVEVFPPIAEPADEMAPDGDASADPGAAEE